MEANQQSHWRTPKNACIRAALNYREDSAEVRAVYAAHGWDWDVWTAQAFKNRRTTPKLTRTGRNNRLYRRLLELTKPNPENSEQVIIEDLDAFTQLTKEIEEHLEAVAMKQMSTSDRNFIRREAKRRAKATQQQQHIGEIEQRPVI